MIFWLKKIFREPLPFVDQEQKIFCVPAGRPKDPSYMQACGSAFEFLDGLRPQIKCEEVHRRGRFKALNAGISYGGGQKVCDALLSQPLLLMNA
jgi:hypothetical protein